MSDHEQYLTAAKVCAHLNISPKTLAAWRREGEGPGCVRFGGQILYPQGPLQIWEREHPHKSARAHGWPAEDTASDQVRPVPSGIGRPPMNDQQRDLLLTELCSAVVDMGTFVLGTASDAVDWRMRCRLRGLEMSLQVLAKEM